MNLMLTVSNNASTGTVFENNESLNIQSMNQSLNEGLNLNQNMHQTLMEPLTQIANIINSPFMSIMLMGMFIVSTIMYLTGYQRGSRNIVPTIVTMTGTVTLMVATTLINTTIISPSEEGSTLLPKLPEAARLLHQNNLASVTVIGLITLQVIFTVLIFTRGKTLTMPAALQEKNWPQAPEETPDNFDPIV